MTPGIYIRDLDLIEISMLHTTIREWSMNRRDRLMG